MINISNKCVSKTKVIVISILLMLLINEMVLAQAGSKIKLFTEVYNETTHINRDKHNIITMVHAFQGARISVREFRSIDLYFKQQLGADVNKDFWNNKFELMLGARVRFFDKVYLAFFCEYIRGKFLDIDNAENPNPDINYQDLRYGMIFWNGWYDEYYNNEEKTYPISFWQEVYAEAIFYKRDSKNFILYVKSKAGVSILRIHKTFLDLYGISYLMYDKNGDFWNNKFEIGGGLRIRPWMNFNISIFFEFLRGFYIERSGRYPNLNEPTYFDVRVGLMFWHSWEF